MQHLRIEPFTAAHIETLGEQARRATLTAIGLRHMKRARAMLWDGADPSRAHSLACQAYRAALAA